MFLFSATAACLALSGAAALVAEVLWVRLLTLTFGVGASATAVVLAVFMAGLGLGAALAERAARGRMPLRCYAAAEALAAAGIAASSLMLFELPRWLAPAVAAAGDGALLIALRAAASAAMLLIPATAMGMSTPLAVRAVRSLGAAPGRAAGALYAANTAGACAGALAAAHWTVDLLGRAGSLRAAAAAGALAATAAFGFSFIFPSTADAAPPPAAAPPIGPAPDPHRRAAFAVTFLCGAGALACESMWTRAILYVVGDNSAYAFAHMLAMMLFATAVGAALAAAAPLREEYKRPALAAVLCALAAVAAWSVGWFEPQGRGGGLLLSDGESAPWSAFVSRSLRASAAVAGAPSLLLGAAFALCARVAAPARAVRGFDAMLIFNTAGCVAGAWLGGFVLLPACGFRAGLAAASLLFLLAAAVAARGAGSAAVRAAPAVLGLASAAAVTFGFLSPPGAITARSLLESPARDEVVYYNDGPESSIAVVEDRVTGAVALCVNGDLQASTDPGGMLHLRLLGHLPALLHPSPKTALVIGLGAGVTAGSVAAHPFESIDICELSRDVLAVNRAGRFDRGNGGVVGDPRVHISITDGRTRLLSSPKSYDVITCDPVDPDDDGVSSLYSLEFYQQVLARLNPGGTACQWMPTHYSLDVFRTMLATFRAAFPECYLYTADYTAVVVGRKPGGAPLEYDHLQAALERPAVARSLGEVGIDGAADLFALQLADPDAIARFTAEAGGRVNTDDRPFAETAAFRGLFGRTRADDLAARTALFALRSADARLPADVPPGAARSAFEQTFESAGRALRAGLVLRGEPGSAEREFAARVAAFDAYSPRFVDLVAGFDTCDSPPGASDRRVEFLLQSGIAAAALDPYTHSIHERALEKLDEALALRPASVRARCARALAFARAGMPDAAVADAAEALRRARFAESWIAAFASAEMTELAARADAAGADSGDYKSFARLSGAGDDELRFAGCAEWWGRRGGALELRPDLGRFATRPAARG